MSRQPYGTTTPEQRDQAAEDRDQAAWQRDRAGAARDRAADERNRRAEARAQAVLQYTRVTLRQLDTAAEEPGADQRVIRAMLRHLDEALGHAGMNREAATRDRQAAAADRRQAAQDRFISSEHRGQAAIERAQKAREEPAPVSPLHWTELYARAHFARDCAEALREPSAGS
ncbi:MAG TPA: hypothetical protein VGQ05_13275 [Streptosporangiaceae bacterium]|jgi:hypothetical protein|nr:hypothetical protein [Streptosporangiaceae bacterium]